MAKSLAKIQKKISKKKGNVNSLHEKSRDSYKLRRATARAEKLKRRAAERVRLNQYYVDRITFFQEAAKVTTGVIGAQKIHSLVQGYIKRHNEELAHLQSDRRPGRPSNPHEGALKNISTKEDREYSSGFWMPDMENEENLKMLRDWDRQWLSLSTLKFVRLMHGGAVNPSSFPPKGNS